MKLNKSRFSVKLADKLSGIGKTVEDGFDDNSGRWVSLKIDDTNLEISFDPKGQEITSIDLWQDVVQVVDQKKCWPLSND